jgi:hypothetical protein
VIRIQRIRKPPRVTPPDGLHFLIHGTRLCIIIRRQDTQRQRQIIAPQIHLLVLDIVHVVVVLTVRVGLGQEGRETQVLLTNVLRDERFERVETGGGAGVGFGEDGDDGCYSRETGEDVGVEGVETVGEGVVVVRRGRVDHVECTVNVCIQMFLRTLHFRLLRMSINDYEKKKGEGDLCECFFEFAGDKVDEESQLNVHDILFSGSKPL